MTGTAYSGAQAMHAGYHDHVLILGDFFPYGDCTLPFQDGNKMAQERL